MLMVKKKTVFVAQLGCTVVLKGRLPNIEYISEDNKPYDIKKEIVNIAKDAKIKIGEKVVLINVVKAVDDRELEISEEIAPTELPKRLRDLEIGQANLIVNVNTLWVIFASSLVFFMNAGFALLEVGFSSSYDDNIPILAKNLMVFAATIIVFWLFGFGLMFGDTNSDHFLFNFSDKGILGNSGFLLKSLSENSPTIQPNYKGEYNALAWAGIPLKAKFFFQTTFAATAATIVSGCRC